ncbi:related to Mitochondrial inner membrane protease subunit 1 [Saccharomycodes ludwigii]|uniref:Mitochondrial inner membrane protease subunit n=2 Tax=Saccharomycodes ludwigii TaxID=36035 RepID=A0A376B4X9_9ASCO|nr:related to Mitochondrial inner membrane protease subunit 1 [Saccharomycodes ludwigii]
MLPTLNATGDFVHVSKYYKDGKKIEIGDCIVASKPTDPHQRVCKRITGMPGDIILVDPSMGSKLNEYSTIIAQRIQDSKENHIDDQEYKELLDLMDETSTSKLSNFNEYVKVPPGHVWLTGDNLSCSVDSRTYNFVPMGLIRGKIVAANDFNKSFNDNFWGFRWIKNNYFTLGGKE